MCDIHQLTSREFEVLAANYAKSIFPDYEWRITKAVGDYNRDFEAVVECLNKWGEAKLTKNKATSVSKGRWDPTLLSAVLKNNVDELILITSGWIPLEYIVRACHMAEATNTINKIIFINGYIVNEWLKTRKGGFCNFEAKNIDLNLKKIIPVHYENNVKCIIQIFDMYNILEPQKELSALIPYKIHITFFVMSDSKVIVSIPNCFKINSIKFVNLSDKSETDDYVIAGNKPFNYIAKQGYNQIVISGHGIYNTSSDSSNEIKVSINEVQISQLSIIIKEKSSVDCFITEQVSKIEKERDNCLSFKNNAVVNVSGLSRNDITMISDKCQRFFFFRFSDSYCKNAVELCRILALLIFGVYNDKGKKKAIEAVVNSTLNYCPTYLSNILIGTTDYIYAVEAMKELLNTRKIFTAPKYMVPDKSTIFIEISGGTVPEVLNMLETQLSFFKMQYNSSIVILSKKTDANESLTHEEANTIEIKLVDEIQSKESPTDDSLLKLQKIADNCYESSDFFRAKFFYDLLFQKSTSIEHDLFEVFNYADSLNHCNSMTRSKELFAMAVKMDIKNDPERKKKILEAQTELFNLRFWSLDVVSLVDDIDRLMEEKSSILLSDNGGTRELYAYYNCLNRKMVTQYLIGDYKNAEITFNEYINKTNSDDYKNYMAFAYMDSARGLYAHDIQVAKCRLVIAQKILEELAKNNKEQRRYLDCNVELAFVDFISEYEKGNHPSIQPLELAVTKVRINGFKSMLLKCNLKLAACYLALGNTEECQKCLDYVKGSCNLDDNPRVRMLYNNLLCGLYSVLTNLSVQEYGIAKDYQPKCAISFNSNAEGKIIIEPRLW